MRRIAGLTLASMLFVSVSASAATLPGGIGDDYYSGMNLEKLTVGANFEDIQRFVEVGDSYDYELNATSYSLFLGYDVMPWVTLFGTLGMTESDTTIPDVESDNDSMLKWSFGVNGNLYKWDFRRPQALMGDRLNIKCFLEYADYQKDQNEGEVDWSDLVLALPVAYERFERNPKLDESELYRLVIYAGPLLSLIDGSIGTQDFEQSQSMGLLAGIDVYLTSSVTLGGQVQMFDIDGDDIHARASFRYHF